MKARLYIPAGKEFIFGDDESLAKTASKDITPENQLEVAVGEKDIFLKDLYDNDIVRCMHVSAGSAFVCKVKPRSTPNEDGLLFDLIEIGPSSTPIQNHTAIEKVGDIHTTPEILDDPEIAFRKEVDF